MEVEVLEASNPLSAEGDSLVLDADLYDTDTYDIPDPGLLSEEDELYITEPERNLQFFASSQRWQNLTLRARARQLWLLLRTGLRDIVEKEKRAELHVARLTHGLEPLRRLEVAAGPRSVALDPVGGHLVVLDGECRLHLHRKDGWAQGKLLAPVALTGLAAVLGPLGAVGRFVGWGPQGLAILRPDLSLLWLSKPGADRPPSDETICCLPVPDLGLLLVAQASGGLALWKFRSGGRRLVPRGSPLQPPASLEGPLKRLALWPAPPHCVPRCVAAYGSAVLTLDLQEWALVDVRRDLHKTTISDLAYCEDAEVMVTASRDTTVKVWEADWQIRMVFVGHTGPVTAMTVLPNTTLVVSASQDGTLRTWDLQAAAQVGEVSLCYWCQDALSARVNRLLAPAGPGWPVLSLCATGVGLWCLRELHSPLAQLPAPVLHLQAAPPLPAPEYPSLPARLVCACADGSVYLVSAVTGRLVSALLLGPEDLAASVAYCLPREALWLLTRAGHLVLANAARCPMRVLHRSRPPPPPAPQPCCLHLYSHLTDPSAALASWEAVRERGGEMRHSAASWAWKNKNRYLPVVGYSDGSLSVLEGRTSKAVFRTEAHSPGPVTAIASTWSSIVTSGGDLTVKMWRVFPYAEESLSLLRTFCCCQPGAWLCALGRRVTVGFEAPQSATYGLVQFGLGSERRCDHRPQDDPLDHITGLCCCPTLKLYACSSLDCTVRIWTADNRLLRLLQLGGAPQALAFCSNSGDLVLALGSHLCLVSHKLYLPTSYLVKKLCMKEPDVVDDPPLPLTNKEQLTSAQLQRLATLHGVASLSVALTFVHHQSAVPQEPVLKEDLEALVARDRDLKQLRLGLVVPEAPPPLSWQQRQEAFDRYLRLIRSPGLLDFQSVRGSQQWAAAAFSLEREARGTVSPGADVQTAPAALPRRFARPPRVALPLPPAQHEVHSKVSQLLVRSSLSYELGLGLDMLLESEQVRREMTVGPNSPSHLQHRIPLLLRRRPREPLSKLRGFFPATPHPHKGCPLPIGFPGFVPNSTLLQQMWLPAEVSCLGSLAQLASRFRRRKPGGSRGDDLWLHHPRRSNARWKRRWLQWLRGKARVKEEEEEERKKVLEEEEEDLGAVCSSASLSPQRLRSEQRLESLEPKLSSAAELTPEALSSQQTTRTKTGAYPQSQYPRTRTLWEERYGHLPKFLHFFVSQNWFKKLFPIITLEAYPEMGTVEGLASMLLDKLPPSSWADRVHILHALLMLLPDLGHGLRGRLRDLLLHLLNLDQPPSFQDPTQKQFVMLALQLLLACFLESQDTVLELMSYFLYSPDSCRPELMKLMDRLGLQDPQGFLFKEMLTWAQGAQLSSKSTLRRLCCQKLEGMIQQLQTRTMKAQAARPEPSALPPPPQEAPSKAASPASPWHLLEPPLPAGAGAELQAQPVRSRWTKRALSETLQNFCGTPRPSWRSPASPALPERPPLPHGQMLDLGCIDALNYFCEQQRAQQLILLWEEAQRLRSPEPNTVVRPPQDRRRCPVLRLQEAQVHSSEERPRGWMPAALRTGRPRPLDVAIRALKLPLPRVEVQPFPAGWPRPARPRCPLPLQPGLQRYFVPGRADPDGLG
ncbi:LOW QUALITY PROTEIN: WD repeat-containing protein 97 [Lepus europaeus]|uniref:LOW QUALITY PROTEIN: WD repeat-containing protein 97 n=1 Tax=Lepus europaeus TaxID=9983 RepID=UPI002B49753A|nr:LOW QUALITY PROTEIN: WD repeat-containing protein 97 [Lepus europaeus]